MKKAKLAGIALVLGMLTMAALDGVSYAQRGVRPLGEGPGARGWQGPGGMPMGMGFRGIDLTEEQKSQIKVLHEQSRESARPLHEQLKPIYEQMQALIRSGDFNEGAARALATQQAQLMTELTVIHARTEAAVFNLLTPEQKAKLAAPPQRGNRSRPGGKERVQ
ncbi:MAG: Spy/CpxP family protein refolding chaperone [Blastocatellia bacterium]